MIPADYYLSGDPTATPAQSEPAPVPTGGIEATVNGSSGDKFLSVKKTPSPNYPEAWEYCLGPEIPRNKVIATTRGLLAIASPGLAFYHGYRRNGDSFGWGLAWAIMGRIAPVLTPALAVAQGLGKPVE